jgi:hypothetical protein
MPTPHERVRAICIAGALVCLAIFLLVRIDLVRNGGESTLDRWVAEQVGHHRNESPTFELIERAVTAPGSRKGAMLLSLTIGALAWLRYRDLRWTALLVAAFVATDATVMIVKAGLVLEPFHANLGRAYLSEHTANAAAVFGMLLVLSILTHERGALLLAIGAVGGGVVTLVAASIMVAGHHWFSDVLGGLAVAGAWIFAFTPAAHSLWRRPDLVAAARRSRVPALPGPVGPAAHEAPTPAGIGDHTLASALDAADADVVRWRANKMYAAYDANGRKRWTKAERKAYLDRLRQQTSVWKTLRRRVDE